MDKGSSYGSAIYHVTSSAHTATIKNCIGIGGVNYGTFYLKKVYVINCMAIDALGSGFQTKANYYGYIAIHCIAVNAAGAGFLGISGNDNETEGVSLQNCIAYNCGTDYDIGAPYTAGCFNNATSDSSATEAFVTLLDIVAGDFLDPDNDNYNIL